jgi:ABC-2 type transport system ATP-binding protein
MIRIKGLKKEYKNVKALKGIDINVAKGEIFSLLGPNGAGKTTTIRIITGLTKKDAGEIFIKDIDIFKYPDKGKKLIGLIPQSVNLDVDLTVNENMFVHGLLYSMPLGEIKEKSRELLEYVGVYKRKDSKVKTLSGGMRRRVLIARALLHSPEVLFLDEPTVGLDPNIRRKIWWLIKKIQEQGTTIFLTTHYIEEAEFLSDKVAFLDEGEIVKYDTPENLIKSLGEWAVDFLDHEKFNTLFFKTKEEIKKVLSEKHDKFHIRRVNLEDAFITYTGKRMGNG